MTKQAIASQEPRKRRIGAGAIVSLFALTVSSTVGISRATTASTKLDFFGGGGLRNRRNLRDAEPCDCIGMTVGTLLYNVTDRWERYKDVEYAIRRATEGVRAVTLRPMTVAGTTSKYQLWKPTLHNATECGCDHYEFSGLPDVKAPYLNMTYTVRCCRDAISPLPHENICIMYKNMPMCGRRNPPEEDPGDSAETTGICMDFAQMSLTPQDLIDACENNRRCGNPIEGGNPTCNDPGRENCCPPGEGDCFPNHCAINKKSCGADNGRGDLAVNTQTGSNMCMHDVDCTHDESICDALHGMKCFDECGPEY